MKRILHWLIYGLLVVPAVSNMLHAQGADGDYIAIYKLIKQADQYRDTGLSDQAAAAYALASKQLRAFQNTNPSWNSRVIQFRMSYLTREMEKMPNPALSSSVNHAVPSKSDDTSKEDIETAVAEVTHDLGGQIQALNVRIEQLQEENRLYMAKLREAMGAKPAGFNPEELQRAEARIMELQKERELLKVKYLQATSGSNQDGAPDLQTQLKNAAETIEQQEILIGSLRREITASGEGADEGDRDQLVQELMEQNAVLRRQAQASTESSKPLASSDSDLKPVSRSSKPLRGRSWWPFSRRRNPDKEDQWMEAKIAAYEAESIPYRPEELALMEKRLPDELPIPAEIDPNWELNAEQAAIAASLEQKARQAQAAGDLATALSRFKEILQMVPDNAHTLSNLGQIQMQMNAPEEAEATLQRALSIHPDHVYALFLSGQLKFLEQDYEGALGFLAQAARLDPNDAEVQSQLGSVLSQLGQRAAGETALRKALHLDPNLPNAHFNLAVVYASYDPPYKELARHHYQKALEGGLSKEPVLERLIEGGE